MMLEVRDLHAFYGKSHILQGVDLRVDQGEIVSLLGRNGVGRSTACKTIMGLVPPVGQIGFKGRAIAGLRPDQIAHLGIGYVPEDRQVFPGLTVRQNLELGLKRAGVVGRWKFEDVFALFPNLAARQDNPAGVLSGGEQQMLTMCRTLMGDPDLVIIDEPTEGLAPKLVEQVGTLLDEIAKRGTAILLVEQKLTIALKNFPPPLRDGPRPHRVRGNARRARRQCRRAQGVAGGLGTPRTQAYSEQCLCGWRGRDRSYWIGHHHETIRMLPSQRALFDIPRDICYLNAASYSPLPIRTLEAGRAAVGRKGTPWTLEASFANQQHERARTAAARLIHAEPSDIALIPSISYGVATAAKLLTTARGTRVIVLENDHSSPVLEWHARAEAQGFTVETVRATRRRRLDVGGSRKHRTIRRRRRSAWLRSRRCTGRTAG